jgi:hypothetical protein
MHKKTKNKTAKKNEKKKTTQKNKKKKTKECFTVDCTVQSTVKH